MILTKHLTNLGQIWLKYLPSATMTYNTLNSPNLVNYSPYELVFSRKPKLDVDLLYCWINLVEAWYSLEQYIGFEGRQAFIHYCGLHQVWREPEN